MDSIDGHRRPEAGKRSVLLIKPGSMGDVIHALPVAAAIRQAWPDAVLTWVIDPRWAPLLDGNPAVSRTLVFPREEFRGPAGWARAARWYAGLRGARPAVAVDLQGLLRSALMANLSGAALSVGLSDAREGARFFYGRVAGTVAGEHAVLRYLRCLPPLGIAARERPEFFLPPGTPPALPEGYVALHPFARGAEKSMGAGALRAFVEEFRASSERPLVIVGAGGGRAPLPEDVIDLTGKTSLPELVAILRGARFAVSADSGPMHLAAALGVPLLGVHTWSDPRLVGPFSESAWIWQGGEIRRQDFGRPPLPQAPFAAESAREAARFVAARTAEKSR